MKAIYLLMMMFFIGGGGCSDRDDYIEDKIPPFDSTFDFSFSGKSSDVYKVNIQTLDKIEPKPMFHDYHYMKKRNIITKGAFEVIIKMTEHKINDAYNRSILFNPMYADKERLLAMKIYKNNRLIINKMIGYTSHALSVLYDRGNANKGDVLSLGQITFYTRPKVKLYEAELQPISEKKEVVGFDGRIEAEGVKVYIANKNELP